MVQVETQQKVKVQNVHIAKFKRDINKNEGGIVPDSGSTIVI